MRIGLTEVRNADYQDRHFYLIEVKTRNMKVLTLGKFNERQLLFEYYNYYTNRVETVDILKRESWLAYSVSKESSEISSITDYLINPKDQTYTYKEPL